MLSTATVIAPKLAGLKPSPFPGYMTHHLASPPPPPPPPPPLHSTQFSHSMPNHNARLREFWSRDLIAADRAG
ncbi:hypothetical protein GJ744_004752 [Endocarpon pusillum]|uniref:Uncharacterized protein n=1 Tax=Endocarpon pusillum TaxID=364733 RepID=A0A8H7E1H0_9EURO|nr:hypothetical protein GJ744_004752 [Endocarpon pusillum]